MTVNPKVFTIRYRSEVSTKHCISYDGDIYLITGITEIGRKEGQASLLWPETMTDNASQFKSTSTFSIKPGDFEKHIKVSRPLILRT